MIRYVRKISRIKNKKKINKKKKKNIGEEREFRYRKRFLYLWIGWKEKGVSRE